MYACCLVQFTGLFGGKFSLPKVKLGGSIIQGFKNGVDKIRDSIENVMKEKKVTCTPEDRRQSGG